MSKKYESFTEAVADGAITLRDSKPEPTVIRDNDANSTVVVNGDVHGVVGGHNDGDITFNF